jgi:hypothetical protein
MSKLTTLELNDEITFAGIKNKVTSVNCDGTIRLTEIESGKEHGCYHVEDVLKNQYPTDINYRELLKKYVNHVIECEGIDYLGTAPGSELTDEDITNIKNLFI